MENSFTAIAKDCVSLEHIIFVEGNLGLGNMSKDEMLIALWAYHECIGMHLSWEQADFIPITAGQLANPRLVGQQPMELTVTEAGLQVDCSTVAELVQLFAATKFKNERLHNATLPNMWIAGLDKLLAE